MLLYTRNQGLVQAVKLIFAFLFFPDFLFFIFSPVGLVASDTRGVGRVQALSGSKSDGQLEDFLAPEKFWASLSFVLFYILS